MPYSGGVAILLPSHLMLSTETGVGLNQTRSQSVLSCYSKAIKDWREMMSREDYGDAGISVRPSFDATRFPRILLGSDWDQV